MTAKIRADGGYAFSRPPVWSPDGQQALNESTGMTLRDYFAAAALTGLLASGKWHNSGTGFETYIAVQAGNIADAMLAQRLKDTSA